MARPPFFGTQPGTAGLSSLQALGAIATYLLLLACIGLCLANISAALLAAGTWGRPIWLVMFWAGRATTSWKAIWWLILLAILGVGFTSGLAFEAAERLQEWLRSA